MPNWGEVVEQINRETVKHQKNHPIDSVRRRYLASLAKHTGRNTIAYYSGWMGSSVNRVEYSINDQDKNAFMSTIHKMDRTKGLDIILHTPGGDLAATESLVDYLRQMFGTNIRAIIPQIAMSAGTMLACSCQSIIMGKESNLGPIDPQIGGVPAQGIITEFDTAVKEIQKNPASLPLWQQIIGKYHPSFIIQCRQSIDWSENIVKDWLATSMFSNDPDPTAKAESVVQVISSYQEHKAHNRHISMAACQDMGLNIEALEDDEKLQDLVLTVHHTYMHTFSKTNALKIVENHKGIAMVIMPPQQ